LIGETIQALYNSTDLAPHLIDYLGDLFEVGTFFAIVATLVYVGRWTGHIETQLGHIDGVLTMLGGTLSRHARALGAHGRVLAFLRGRSQAMDDALEDLDRSVREDEDPNSSATNGS